MIKFYAKMALDVYVWGFYHCFLAGGLVIFLLVKTKKVGLVFWCAKKCEKKYEKMFEKILPHGKKNVHLRHSIA